MSFVAGLLVVVVPGALSWWWGRRLALDPDDPALPERLAAHRGRVTGVLLAAIVLAAFLLHRSRLPILFFGAWVGTLVGAFSWRRPLFKETWSLGTYLGYQIRALVAFAGPWFLLALAPALVAARSGSAAWLTAGLLFVLIVVWQRGYHSVLLRLLEARELDRPDLAPLFEAVVAKSTVAPPRLYLLDPNGGRWANAVALPRIRPPSAVLFTRTLLDELTPAESAAIFAHEVAHLEHFDRKRLMRAATAQIIAASIACTIALLMPEGWEPWRSSIALLLAPVIIVALGLGIARRNKHEGESDLRAVELCGDAEALASALAKLHALARLPRRLASESESMRSHPSLARRLQAIRRAGGSVPAPEAEFVPLVVRGAGGKFVVLDRGRAEWLEGIANAAEPLVVDDLRSRAGVAKSYAYGELVELRLEIGRAKPNLVARTRSEKWSLPLEAADGAVIAALQAKLDELDGKLGVPPGSSTRYEVAAPLVSFLLFLLTIAAVRSLPAASAAVVAVVQPAAATLAGAAGAALAAAAIALFDVDNLAYGLVEGAVAALALLLFWAARERGKSEERELGGRFWLAVAVLVVAAIPSAVGFVLKYLQVDSIAGASLAARFPGLTVSLLGVASALVFSRRVAPAIVVALAALIPFAAPQAGPSVTIPKLPLAPLTLPEVGRFAVPNSTVGVRSSPGGAVYALDLREYEDDEFESDEGSTAPVAPKFEVGPLDAERTTIEGFELAFLDDRRVLVVAVSQGRAELREVDLRKPGESRWKAAIPHLVQPHLAVDPRSSAFWLVGKEPRTRSFVRLRGKVGDAALREERWTTPANVPLTFYEWYPAEGPRALALGMRTLGAPSYGYSWMLALVDPTLLYHHELWAVGGAAPPRRVFNGSLTLSCAQPPFGAATIACASIDGKTTNVVSIAPSSDSVAQIASVPRILAGAGLAAASESRLAAASGSDVVLLDLAALRGKVMRVGAEGSVSWVRAVALAGERLAVLAQGASPNVLLYDVSP